MLRMSRIRAPSKEVRRSLSSTKTAHVCLSSANPAGANERARRKLLGQLLQAPDVYDRKTTSIVVDNSHLRERPHLPCHSLPVSADPICKFRMRWRRLHFDAVDTGLA